MIAISVFRCQMTAMVSTKVNCRIIPRWWFHICLIPSLLLTLPELTASQIKNQAGKQHLIHQPPDMELRLILTNLVENAARFSIIRTQFNTYTFSRTLLRQELSGDGEVEKREEKVYSGLVRRGKPRPVLESINGKALSATEKSGRKSGGRSAYRPQDGDKPFLSHELLARFDLRLVTNTVISGRQNHQILFGPKMNAQENSMEDKVLNQLQGTIWVDAEDFEITRMEAKLRGKTSFWGGIVGVLRSFSLSLTRLRLEPGLWVTETSNIKYEGRKILGAIRLHTEETYKDFAPLKTPPNNTGEPTP